MCLVEGLDGTLGADVVGGEVLGQILREQGDVRTEGKEVVQEPAAGLFVDGDGVFDVPVVAGLGGEDEVASVSTAARHATGGLAISEPEGFDVALELGDGFGVGGGVVGLAEQCRLFPLDDEAVVDGVRAAGGAEGDFGVWGHFDALGVGEFDQVLFDNLTEGFFEDAVF